MCVKGRPRTRFGIFWRPKEGISILVLAAGTGSEGPGPLVSALTGKMAGRVRVPVTVVPGSLTRDEILRLA